VNGTRAARRSSPPVFFLYQTKAEVPEASGAAFIPSDTSSGLAPRFGNNGGEIPHQFFLWRKTFPIHHRESCPVTLTKRFKPVIAKADKTILEGDDQALDMTKFSALDHLIKAFSLVGESRTHIFDPLIDGDSAFLGVGAKGFLLGSEVASLGWRRNTGRGNSFSLRTCYQSTLV
jgi:hypothetical protein